MSKLREKFENEIDGLNGSQYIDESKLINECEQITDDFSVKFAEFLYEQRFNSNDIFWKPTTELLQIFKDKYYE